MKKVLKSDVVIPKGTVLEGEEGGPFTGTCLGLVDGLDVSVTATEANVEDEPAKSE